MRLIKFTLFAFAFSFFQISQAQNWEIVHTSDSCTNRHECSLVALDDKIILLGGRGVKPTEVFDTKNKVWTKKIETPLEIHHFQTITYKGEVYVMGAFTGQFPHETPVENIYIFNIKKNEWRKGPAIPKDRLRGGTGCTVYNNKIYLVCGIQDGHWSGHVAWFDEYDPSTNLWRKLPDAPHSRDHMQVAIINNKLYVAGGRKSSGKTNQYLDLTEGRVDVYDFAKNSWQTLPESLNIPTQRAGCSATVFNKKLVVIGGESAKQGDAHSEVEAFNTKKMRWEKFPNLIKGRHGTAATVINGKIYTVAGCGHSGGSPELNTIEVFK